MRRKLHKVLELEVELADGDAAEPAPTAPAPASQLEVVQAPKKRRSVKTPLQKLVHVLDDSKTVVLSTTEDGMGNLTSFAGVLIEERDRIQALFDAGTLNGTIFRNWLASLEQGFEADVGDGLEDGTEDLPSDLASELGEHLREGSPAAWADETQLGASGQSAALGHAGPAADTEEEEDFLDSQLWPPTYPSAQEPSAGRKRGASSTPLVGDLKRPRTGT